MARCLNDERGGSFRGEPDRGDRIGCVVKPVAVFENDRCKDNGKNVGVPILAQPRSRRVVTEGVDLGNPRACTREPTAVSARGYNNVPLRMTNAMLK